MNEINSIRTIAVTGGKGGVGKTNVAVNVGLEMVKRGMSVLLLDADLGLANVDIMLDLKPKYDLYNFILGQCELEELIVEGPDGLDIVPAASGIEKMAKLTSFEQASLIKAFSDLEKNYDVMIIDTAAGIAPSVINFAKAAQEVVVVMCDEPSSMADAYALVKVLNRHHGVNRIQLLANMVSNPEQGKALYSRLSEVADNYLNVVIGYLGSIPMDKNVRKAAQLRSMVTQKYPYSASSIAFQQLARRLINLPSVAGINNGNVEFFVEKHLPSRVSLSEM